MTFRIERSTNGEGVILALSGDIANDHAAELDALVDLDGRLTLDLADVGVIDRAGVLFLARCERRGATLMNCPRYVGEWIERERNHTRLEENDMTHALASTASEDTFHGLRDFTIFFRSWRPPGTARGLVVIIPGFNSHSAYYAWVAEQFVAKEVAVYALDLRGRGKSDGERFFVESFDDYVSDVATFVALARAREPGVPTFVLGHSAGGVVSCLYALDHQNELAGLICESFAHQLPAPDFALAVLKGLSHVAPHAHVLHLKNETFSRDPVVVATMNADPLIAHETQPTQTVAALVHADERLKKEFPRLTLPVLILHGTRDEDAKPSGSQFFYDTVGSRDKTLKLYDGHVHDLLNDVGKEAVMADITFWIGERAGVRS
jgi:alpha-beta hydrolase superfamily lysophospholipase